MGRDRNDLHDERPVSSGKDEDEDGAVPSKKKVSENMRKYSGSDSDGQRKSRRKKRESSGEEDERRGSRSDRRKRKSRGSNRSDEDSETESDSDDDDESEYSRSASAEETGSESESEEDRRRRKKKERRRREREEERERKRRKREKEKKRRKKEKEDKRKKKEKQKEKKEKGKRGAVTDSWGKYGVIRETDMWNKRPEFTAWLAEVRQVNLESLANWEEKQMFKQFMEDHNTATFPSKKYYNLDAYHKRKLEKEMKKGIKKVMQERTIFNDEEQRRLELLQEREKKKEEQVQALKLSMQSGMAQAMKEQAQLREEMAYQYKIGNFEAAAAIQRRLEPDLPM